MEVQEKGQGAGLSGLLLWAVELCSFHVVVHKDPLAIPPREKPGPTERACRDLSSDPGRGGRPEGPAPSWRPREEEGAERSGARRRAQGGTRRSAPPRGGAASAKDTCHCRPPPWPRGPTPGPGGALGRATCGGGARWRSTCAAAARGDGTALGAAPPERGARRRRGKRITAERPAAPTWWRRR